MSLNRDRGRLREHVHNFVQDLRDSRSGPLLRLESHFLADFGPSKLDRMPIWVSRTRCVLPEGPIRSMWHDDLSRSSRGTYGTW